MFCPQNKSVLSSHHALACVYVCACVCVCSVRRTRRFCLRTMPGHVVTESSKLRGWQCRVSACENCIRLVDKYDSWQRDNDRFNCLRTTPWRVCVRVCVCVLSAEHVGFCLRTMPGHVVTESSKLRGWQCRVSACENCIRLVDKYDSWQRDTDRFKAQRDACCSRPVHKLLYSSRPQVSS